MSILETFPCVVVLRETQLKGLDTFLPPSFFVIQTNFTSGEGVVVWLFLLKITPFGYEKNTCEDDPPVWLLHMKNHHLQKCQAEKTEF